MAEAYYQHNRTEKLKITHDTDNAAAFTEEEGYTESNALSIIRIRIPLSR
jgi:hypothetical protein